MITEMEKLSVYAMSGDADKLINKMLKIGCVEINAPETTDEFDELSKVTERKDQEIFELEQALAHFSHAIKVLKPYEGKKGLFDKAPIISFDELESQEDYKQGEFLCFEIDNITDEINNQKSALEKLNFRRKCLVPWTGMEIPGDSVMPTTCRVLYLAINGTGDFDDFADKLSEAAEESFAKLIYTAESGSSMSVGIIYHISAEKNVFDFVKNYDTQEITFEKTENSTVGIKLAKCDNDIKLINDKLDELRESLKTKAEKADLLKKCYDYLTVRLDEENAKQQLLYTEKAVIFSAWVPQPKKEKAEKVLQQYSCYYEFQLADPKKDNPPILFKNSKLVEPFGVITEMYAMPAYNGIDPNPYITPFFFITFGMMLSDAGYGLLIVIAGLIMLKFMDLKGGTRKLVKVIIAGGISTFIWGAIYGSWFSDLPATIANKFLGFEGFEMPALIEPLSTAPQFFGLSGPILILVLSFVVGVMHIFVGMGLKAYLLIKRGHFWSAVFDIGFWYTLLIGLGLLYLGGTCGEVGKWMSLASAAGLVLTQGRSKKNIFGKVSSGVLSLYDITGYASDILSYSRILALGVATGVIGQVVNIMGSMLGPSIGGVIMFLLVFVFGHLLNLGINTMGAYVHSCRLQYVEFFGRFYEDGGRPFRPLRAETKYNCITNKEDN